MRTVGDFLVRFAREHIDAEELRLYAILWPLSPFLVGCLAVYPLVFVLTGWIVPVATGTAWFAARRLVHGRSWDERVLVYWVANWGCVLVGLIGFIVTLLISGIRGELEPTLVVFVFVSVLSLVNILFIQLHYRQLAGAPPWSESAGSPG